jgi:uncharacterized membrane protein YgcG
VRLLVKRLGTSVNTACHRDVTPVHAAAREGAMNSLRCLVEECGARIKGCSAGFLGQPENVGFDICIYLLTPRFTLYQTLFFKLFFSAFCREYHVARAAETGARAARRCTPPRVAASPRPRRTSLRPAAMRPWRTPRAAPRQRSPSPAAPGTSRRSLASRNRACGFLYWYTCDCLLARSHLFFFFFDQFFSQYPSDAKGAETNSGAGNTGGDAGGAGHGKSGGGGKGRGGRRTRRG